MLSSVVLYLVSAYYIVGRGKNFKTNLWALYFFC